MTYVTALFSAFVGMFFAWHFKVGVGKQPSHFLIFFVLFSLGFGVGTIYLAKWGEKTITETITDERIDKILDKSARNSFFVVCVGLVALGIFAPKPFNLVSVSVLAIGILVFSISSIVYERRGDAE